MRRGHRWALLLAFAGGLTASAGAGAGRAEDGAPQLAARAFIPAISRAEEPPPAPLPRRAPYDGPVSSIYLLSAGVTGLDPLEEGDTHFARGAEYLDDPSRPQNIVTYPRFGKPGRGGANTIFAAHVNYRGYGNGPFAHLSDAAPDDAIYVTMANGDVYTNTVRYVATVALTELDMDEIVYPALEGTIERVTLISCGGTFVPSAVGGEYTSRVILVAERYVP